MVIQTDALADTIPVACARLGISRSSAYLAMKRGSLRAVKAGGRTLITRVDQLKWIDSLPAMASAV